MVAAIILGLLFGYGHIDGVTAGSLWVGWAYYHYRYAQAIQACVAAISMQSHGIEKLTKKIG